MIMLIITGLVLLTDYTSSFGEKTRPSTIQKWKNAIVPYQLSEGFSSEEVSVISDTLREVSQKTCVKFELITWDTKGITDYVRIVKVNQGCYSHGLGRVGGPQIVQLSGNDRTCVQNGRIAYQVMRTLGFYPEHLRADRDSFVTIIWNHVLNGKTGFLLKHNTALFNLTDLPYDYDSVTHGDLHKFANHHDAMTIVPTMYGVSTGQRVGFSEGDIRKIRHVYCSATPIFNLQFSLLYLLLIFLTAFMVHTVGLYTNF